MKLQTGNGLTLGWLKKVTLSAATMADKPFQCKYCGSAFTREKTLAVHMCEKKRRHLQKDEKRVQLGLYAFQRFYEISMKGKKQKTYEEFCASPITMLL